MNGNEALDELAFVLHRHCGPEVCVCVDDARELLPAVDRIAAARSQQRAAEELTDLADDFDNGPLYAEATRYFADRDVDADGVDVARIIRAAALRAGSGTP